MNFELTENNVLKYLTEEKLEPHLQKETKQVYIVLKVSSFEIPIFFGILSEGALLQTIAYFPFQLQKNTLPEIARLLHNLNKEIDMPGFGMDERDELLFYRCVIPCLDKTIDSRLLTMCLETSRIVCETFLNVIGLMISGQITIDEFLKPKPND